jgi:putative flavoprotein involved in K+ transport
VTNQHTIDQEPTMTTNGAHVEQPADAVFEVIVIGAGQAGLAIGRALQQRGRTFLIVDAGGEVGHVWRSRWDSLTLFTAARYSGLPGLPFPGDPDSYPTKDAAAQYLRHYASTFELPIRHNTRVSRVTRDGAGFTVHTGGETFRAAQVVVATGPFQNPVIPAIAEGIGPHIPQVHSSAYRNPEQLPDGPVLVVGAANSGAQIATELHRSRPVALSSGSATRALPQRVLGRDLFWWLTTTGLISAPGQSRLGRRFRNGGELLIGTSSRQLARAGVTMHPRVTAADTTTVTFADGSTITPAAIVWATGYRSDYTFLDVTGAVDAAGAPIHQRGVSPVPGLYFLGLPWQHTRGSALLGFVGSDAAHIAAHITAHIPVAPAAGRAAVPAA